MTPDPHMQAQFYEGIATKRLVAWVVDVVLILAVCVLILPFTAFLAIFVFGPLFLVISFVYRWATLTSRSATWGMRLMSMEIRQASDRPLDGGMAFLHTLGYTVSVAMLFPQVISVIMMMNSERGQGLTDMVLGTVAMNKRR